MVRHHRRIARCIAAVAFLAAGCTALGPTGNPRPFESSTLVVQNRGWEDVTVFVVRGSAAIRIGIVPGLGSQLFVLPSAVTGPGLGLQLRGRMRLSGQEFTSHSFDLQSGDDARWVIETLPSLSHVMVR